MIPAPSVTKDQVPINYDAGNNDLEAIEGYFCSGANPAIGYSKNAAYKQALNTAGGYDLALQKDAATARIKKLIQWPTDTKDMYWYVNTATMIADQPDAAMFFDSVNNGSYNGTDRKQMYAILDCPDFNRKYVDTWKLYLALKAAIVKK